MNFVRFKKYVPTNPEMGIGFAEGAEYLMAKHEIEAADRAYVGWRDYTEFSDVPKDKLYDGGLLPSGTTMGFYYPGGIGDGAVCTAFVCVLRARNPNVVMRVFSKFNAACVWYRNPWIEGGCSRPVPMLRQTFDLCDRWMIGDGVVADRTDPEQPNIYDLLSDHFNFKLLPDEKRPFIFVGNEEIDAVREKLALMSLDPNKKLMVISPFATKANRSWPHWQKFQFLAYEAGYEPLILNEADGKFRARELMVLAKIADSIVTVDTGMLHLGAAFEKKTVAIFGPFAPQMRATTYPNCLSLWARRECEHAPCCHHGNGFPRLCPTKADDYCGVLEVVTPDAVLKLVKNADMEIAHV